MKQFRKLINTYSSGKIVLGLFIFTNAVFVFMLTVTIPNTMKFANGNKLLDMMPMGYDLNYVNSLFNALGEAGRETYLTTQLPIDMLYPLLFGITYSLLLSYFLKKLNKHNTSFIYLCLFPIVAGIADYFENIGIIILLQNYPNLSEMIVSTTNVFSVTKSVSTSIYFTTLTIVLVVLGIKHLNKTIIDKTVK